MPSQPWWPEDDRMPCCSGFYYTDDALGSETLWRCNGVMELGETGYVCDTCFGYCGSWSHTRFCGWGTGRPVGIFTGEQVLEHG